MLGILYATAMLFSSGWIITYLFSLGITTELLQSNEFLLITFSIILCTFVINLIVFGYKIAAFRHRKPIKLDAVKISGQPASINDLITNQIREV